MESEPMLTPKGKPPLPEAHRRIEPMMLHHTEQQAQHTTDLAIPAPMFHIYVRCFVFILLLFGR